MAHTPPHERSHWFEDTSPVFLRVASTRLDRQQMIAVYSWDPEKHP